MPVAFLMAQFERATLLTPLRGQKLLRKEVQFAGFAAVMNVSGRYDR